MKVLVTGGSGVIGAGVISSLLTRGHEVRLLSRHASEDVRQWTGVEAFEGDVSEASSVRDAARGCDAVIHIAGIASEHPPESTFERVNTGGTRNMLEEATRSAAARFIYISSLGTEGGASDYHRSKREAESLVQQYASAWTIVRPGNVFGPGDEVISTLIKMVRALPAIPVIDDGEQRFQPIWHEDLGRAIVEILQRGTPGVIELAGSEVTTLNDLLRRIGEITDRKPLHVRVPMPLASLAAKLASLATDVPIDDVKLTMLREENVLPHGARPLADLGIEETSLERGLRLLSDSIPEQLPETGVGSMHHKRFWADIAGSSKNATALLTYFREHVNEVMPIEFSAEPGSPERIEQGITMTGSIPLRGHIQIRVERAEARRVTFVTIEGHPIAGIVEFTTADIAGGAVRFAVDTWSRAANFFDLVALRVVGEAAQSANWRVVVQRMIDASHGTSEGVQQETRKHDDEEAKSIEESVRTIVTDRKREESAAELSS